MSDILKSMPKHKVNSSVSFWSSVAEKEKKVAKRTPQSELCMEIISLFEPLFFNCRGDEKEEKLQLMRLRVGAVVDAFNAKFPSTLPDEMLVMLRDRKPLELYGEAAFLSRQEMLKGR